MIFALIHQLTDAENTLRSAYYLAKKLKRTFGVLLEKDVSFGNNRQTENMRSLLLEFNIPDRNIFLLSKNESLVDFCEAKEVALLVIQLAGTKAKAIRWNLKMCRELRIPYLFYKTDFPILKLAAILVPVGYLEEEYEKVHFASAFARFCGSNIVLLKANDYGSKAATTVYKMMALFDKFQLNYVLQKAASGSHKLDKEAINLAGKEHFDMVLVSASRQYGLDDVIFGSKEYHLLKKTSVPLLLINPRNDLYTLCD